MFSIGGHVARVNMRDFAQLSAEVRRRLAAQEGFALATLNLDHLVKIGADPAFAKAYAEQDLVVADGNPIVALSRLADRPVDLLPGSDLVRPLCDIAAGAGVPAAMVGSDAKTLSRAAAILENETPGLRVVLRHAPPMGFDPAGKEAREVLASLGERGIGLCFVALGAPKQECFAALGREVAPRVGFVSVGAGLDFIAGRQVRAPRWMRRLALEWLWRALSDVRRMVPRYARCFAILPGLVGQALRLRVSGD